MGCESALRIAQVAMPYDVLIRELLQVTTDFLFGVWGIRPRQSGEPGEVPGVNLITKPIYLPFTLAAKHFRSERFLH